jgi:hypothetical protein
MRSSLAAWVRELRARVERVCREKIETMGAAE